MGQEIVAVDSNRSWRDIKTDEHLLPKGRERALLLQLLLLFRGKTFYPEHIPDVSSTVSGTSADNIWLPGSRQSAGDSRRECAAATSGPVLLCGPAAKAHPVLGL